MPPRIPRQLTIGIRREDPARIWERRCPLTPARVRELVEEAGVEVLVQPCERRVFSMSEFVKAGASPHPTLSPAHIVMGIKEPPIREVLTSPLPLVQRESEAIVPRTHLMFSHTTKGQVYNMPLLARFLASQRDFQVGRTDVDLTTEDINGSGLLPRLIDYELLTNGEGKRNVGFGWFAGVAGALESLSAMAQAHLELGVASPFLHTPRPHTHPSLTSLRTALRAVGAHIISEGTPAGLGPCVLGVTGTGKVAQGVLSILEELPVCKITVGELEKIVRDPDTNLHQVYLVHSLPGDYFRRKDGGKYERADYYANPGDYISEFHTKVAPYLTLLLNGTGWSPSFPRLMTNTQLSEALDHAKSIGKGRFASVGDISCDVQGGLEFLTHSTTLSSPFFTARPSNLLPHHPGVQMMAVDILPATLPFDASVHFSEAVSPYLEGIIRAYRGEIGVGKAEVDEALDRATVARNGELVGKHLWLEGEVKKWREEEKNVAAAALSSRAAGAARKKRVLLLGSGMVAGPAVDELCKREDVELVVGSNMLSEAELLTAEYENAKAVRVDMGDQGLAKVRELVREADLVISLLPVPFHPTVAEICIEHRKHLVTASYISPTMKALHDRALASDVLLLNEIGLDPGIDHCSATALLAKLRTENKRVVSFTSFCGGLPAPESLAGDGTGLGYKFSWSPRGVLGAALNGARFKLGGANWEIPGAKILNAHFPDVPIGGDAGVLRLEGIANRDSLGYAGTYGLGAVDGLRTLLRGTLRYPGFSELMHSFKQIGLLEASAPVNLERWNDLTRSSLEKKLGMRVQDDIPSILSALGDVVPRFHVGRLVEALEWLGIMPSTRETLIPSLPKKQMAPIDHFTDVLAQKLKYAPGERDLVVLSHEIVAKPTGISSSSSEEVHTSSLVTYGTSRASAMARTVGLPVAFAALEVLDGGVGMRGVRGPSEDEEIWKGVLAGLEGVGLGMKEGVQKVGMESVLVNGLKKPGL